MYCLHYKTIIIYLKRTEVCLLVKSTLIITIRPCLRFITFLFHSSTLPKSLFFYQTSLSVKFIKSRTSYMLTFESSMVWLKKTTEILQKKQNKTKQKKHSYLNPDVL